MRVLLLSAVFFILVFTEGVFPKRALHDKRFKRFKFHVLVSVMNTLLTRLTFSGLLLLWLLYAEKQTWGLRYLLGIHGWPEILLTIVLADFFEYFWHRMNHQIPLLWRFHRAHHTDRDVDLSTALRFHPAELSLSYGYKAVWIFLWGPSLEAFLISQTLISVYAMMHHSNFDWPDTVENLISKVHMTPRLHTAHHTVSERTRNANYAVIFIIWDRILGTFQASDEEENKNLGVPGENAGCLELKKFLTEPFGMKSR